MKPAGGHAFPFKVDSVGLGMTLRDYFAGQALAGMAIPSFQPRYQNAQNYQSHIATAYLIADAMLAEREKE